MRQLIARCRLPVACFALALAGSVARADEVRLIPDRTAVVRYHDVPWQPRGHSIKWKTGAIITFTSLGVIAMGAAMLFSDWPSDWHHIHKSDALGISGLVIGCVGVGGLVIGGPATWGSGVGEGDDRLDRVDDRASR